MVVISTRDHMLFSRSSQHCCLGLAVTAGSVTHPWHSRDTEVTWRSRFSDMSGGSARIWQQPSCSRSPARCYRWRTHQQQLSGLTSHVVCKHRIVSPPTGGLAWQRIKIFRFLYILSLKYIFCALQFLEVQNYFSPSMLWPSDRLTVTCYCSPFCPHSSQVRRT